MPKTIVKIGPMDDGRQMSLDDFDDAEVQPGYHYELSRGIITVSDVPDLKHFAMVNEVRRQLGRYDLEHPGRIFGIAGSGECKIPLREYQSERHPDLAVYMTPPPGEGSIWGMWIPEIVVEIISARSRHRDYEEKPDEYLQFGISEYWILDEEKRKMVVLKRSKENGASKALSRQNFISQVCCPAWSFLARRYSRLRKQQASRNLLPQKMK